MQISSPKTFCEVPAPRYNNPNRPGRPTSVLFNAVEKLLVGQCIEVKISPGTPPSLPTIRTSVPRWSRKLQRRYTLRLSSESRDTILIYRTK